MEDKYYLIGITEDFEKRVLKMSRTIDGALDIEEEETSGIKSFFVIKGIPISTSMVKTLIVD